MTAAQAGAPLDAGTRAALRDAVAALSPAELREPERVPELALVTTIPDAATTFPTVRETAIRAELAARGIRPEATAPRAPRPGRAHTAWSIVALLLALVAPALIMTGRTGGAALDPASGALPSGIGMILALVILAVLEPGRTRGTLYRGGSVGGGTFVFLAVLWLAAAAIVVVGGVAGEPAAVVGLVLQLVAVAGADRARGSSPSGTIGLARRCSADVRRRPRSTCRASSPTRPGSDRASSAAWRTGVATPTRCSPSRSASASVLPRQRWRASSPSGRRPQGGAPAAYARMMDVARRNAWVVAAFAAALDLALVVCAYGFVSLLTDVDVIADPAAGLLVGPPRSGHPSRRCC